MNLLAHTIYPSQQYPLVLLHGYCEDRTLWHQMATSLSKNHTVICPDLPGFGESTPFAQESFSIDDFAEELHRLLEESGITQCVMIGHSMGGYVGLAFAEKYPEMLAGFGLFHSTAFADSDEKQETRTKAIRLIQEHGTAKFVEGLFPSLFAQGTQTPHRTQLDALVQKASTIPSITAAATMEAMRERPSRLHILQELSVPVLYIVGQQDTTVPVAQSLQECFLAKDSTLVALENAGHMGMIEAHDVTAKRIDEFMRYCNRQTL